MRVSLSWGYCAGRLWTLGSGYHFLVVFVLVAVWVTEPCSAHFAAIVWLAAAQVFVTCTTKREGRMGLSLRGHVGREEIREGGKIWKARGREGGWEGLFKGQGTAR